MITPNPLRLFTPAVIAALIVCAGGVGAHVLRSDRDESIEPSLQFDVKIDGKTFVVNSGEATTIDVGGKQLELVVTERSLRKFEAAGVTFNYPTGMGFEYDGTDPKMWTLDGNNCVINITKLPPDAPGKEVIDASLQNLENNFGKAVEINSQQRTIGGTNYEGKRAIFNVSSFPIAYEYHVLPAQNGFVLLSVQETVAQDVGKAEAEWIWKLLDESFVSKPD